MGNMNKPNMRFPEFQDYWKKIKLGEIGRFSKGKGISKSDITKEGKTECIRYGELYTNYSETIDSVKSKTNVDTSKLILSEENDIIIPASGETQIDIATASCVLKSGIALGGDLNIIKTENDGVFLSYYLNSKKKIDIAKLAQGISVVHLYSSQLSTLNLNLPKLPEQQKIASFFTATDQKISQLKKKKTLLEQYKKGVMQKIFSQEIRFRDDNGQEFPKWEKKRLGEIADVVVGGTPSTSNKEFWDGKVPWIGSGEIKNNIILNPTRYISELGLKKSSAFLMPKGTVVLAMTGATLGKIGLLGIESAGNQSVAGFPPNSRFCSEFLFQLLQFQTNLILSFAGGAAQAGINKNTISGLKFFMPSIPEQMKISSFLSKIDCKINYTQTQIEKSKVWKKGLLQQMFV